MIFFNNHREIRKVVQTGTFFYLEKPLLKMISEIHTPWRVRFITFRLWPAVPPTGKISQIDVYGFIFEMNLMSSNTPLKTNFHIGI